MGLAAGALSIVSVADTSDSLLSAAATSGTSPYTYQWYRSQTTAFVPGSGNLISGATSLALADSGLQAGQTYFYKVVSIDSASTPASVSSSQLQVNTVASQGQNQFAQSPIIGMLDLRFNPNTISAEIDSTETGSLLPGCPVTIVDSVDGVPKVIAAVAKTSVIFGYINFDVKSKSFKAGDKCELSRVGNVMFLVATGAIARGAQVCVDLRYNGGVADIANASSTDVIVGQALDKATAAAQLIRVELDVTSFLAKA